MKIQIIISSTREGRYGDKVAKAVYDVVSKNTEAEFELIDLRDYPLPFFDEAAGPGYLNGNYKHEEGKKWAAKVNEADGYIFVVAEYNHGYTAVMKNALDYAYNEWSHKPVSFVSYGGPAGGARAVEQLRDVTDELKMVPLREQVVIPNIYGALNEDGSVKDPDFATKVEKVLQELLAYTKLLKDSPLRK